ncbi:transporter substrate-binding domain-containing protein [Vibrio sp. S4M6]|uniref:substrate-binding periplasmic protein n=1 Tax=Vibrio sinus TaxID=2946865 RepID=UPI00202A2B00|nr:transporter substrate-binding domain-containing protein [Vibrio sinus]MCL9782694.1 transporter substrate-binding domain-containing protein [Vibrio sinus]
MKKRYFSLLLLFVNSIVQAEIVEVVTEDYAPYTVRKSDNSVGGVATDIVLPVFNRAGIPSKFIIYPWARSYRQALEHKNTFIYAMTRTEKREHLFKWVFPVSEPRKIWFWKLASNDKIKSITSISDAKAFRLATVLDTSIHEYLVRNKFPKISTANSWPQVIKMLQHDRADLILMYTAPLESILKEDNIEEGTIIKTFSPFYTELYLGTNVNTDQVLVDKLQAAYKDLLSSGEIQLIPSK